MDSELQRGLTNATLRVIAVNRAYHARKEYANTPLIIPALCEEMTQRASAVLVCGLRAMVHQDTENNGIVTMFNNIIEDTHEHLFEPLTSEEQSLFFEGIFNQLIADLDGNQAIDVYRLALVSGRSASDYLANFLTAANKKFFDQEEAFLNLMQFYQLGYDSSHYLDYNSYQTSVANLYDVIPDAKFSDQLKERVKGYMSSD